MAEVDAELQEVVNEIFKDPAAAVKKASTPSGREFLPLSALTLTVQDPDLWPQLRDAGFLNLFIELLVDDWTSPRVEVTAPGWVFSLTGIINALVSLKKDDRSGVSSENAEQYEIIRRAYPRIETALWNVHEKADSDKTVNVLALGMYHFARVPDLHPILYTPHTLGIVGHCWRTAQGVAARKVSCVALRQLFAPPPLPSQGPQAQAQYQLPSYALDSFLAMTPFDAIVSRLRATFLDIAITTDSAQLAVELITADCFVHLGHQTASKWVDEARLHAHVVALVEARVAVIEARGEKTKQEEKWVLLDSAAPFLNNIINAATSPADAFTDLIASHGFLELAAEALVIAAHRADSFNSAWFRIFKMLIHTTHCTSTSTCRIHTTPAFASAISAHFTPLFVPTLDKLDVLIGAEASKGMLSSEYDAASDSAEKKREKEREKAGLWQATLTWRALGAGLGVNEEVQRGAKKESVPGKVCWWAKCENEAVKKGEQVKEVSEGEDKPYKRCSGCHAVTYCSAEHQKLDWKDGAHKDVCMILKNA